MIFKINIYISYKKVWTNIFFNYTRDILYVSDYTNQFSVFVTETCKEKSTKVLNRIERITHIGMVLCFLGFFSIWQKCIWIHGTPLKWSNFFFKEIFFWCVKIYPKYIVVLQTMGDNSKDFLCYWYAWCILNFISIEILLFHLSMSLCCDLFSIKAVNIAMHLFSNKLIDLNY